ncbi:MAG TPA: hypothetical protein VE262_12120 [Blastocatellia bacterium]|nr:hypothetical protein [Blastocatellia bacterium]
MSNRVERPVFFENQILGAADLTATVDHSRGQLARHERYLHLWGIAQGLKLEAKEKEEGGKKYKQITLTAGVAIDGTGREIVVPQPETLSENTFSLFNLTGGLDLTEAWFPVFLVGRSKAAPQQPFATGGCDNSLPSREVEGYELAFGRPGTARDLDDQTGGGTADGPGKGDWKILLGYVKYDDTINRFTDLKVDNFKATEIGLRYAGVRADVVAARGGSLKLRTRTKDESNKPALVLNEKNDGLLQFGPLDSLGNVAAVFTVDAQGNVKAEGKISGALTTGGVQVESGIATDGMILPLPPGVTKKQVDAGEAIVQTQISPRLTGETFPPGFSGEWGVFPLEAWVDAERRVHCRVRWFQLLGGSAILDRPGVCTYVVLASLKDE